MASTTLQVDTIERTIEINATIEKVWSTFRRPDGGLARPFI